MEIINILGTVYQALTIALAVGVSLFMLGVILTLVVAASESRR